jgi:hypothetical protein
MAVKLFQINEIVQTAGIINGGTDQAYDISGLDKIRFVVEGAGVTNNFELRVKIRGQSNFTTITSLAANASVLVDVATYDLLQIECTVFDGTLVKLVGVGFKVGGASGVTEYTNFAAFPPATGSGNLGWDASTNTLYYDEPSSSTWQAPSAGAVTLTDEYVGYGSDTDTLTGDANFTYDSLAQTLNIVNLASSTINIGASTQIDEILDEDDMISDSPTALATQQSIVAFVNNTTGGKLYSPENVRTITGSEESNKEIILLSTPTDVTKTRFQVDGGFLGVYGIDFTVSGNVLSWNGLGLDGLLAAGDRVLVTYN